MTQKRPSSFFLDSQHTDPARLKRERAAARRFKKTHVWQQKIQKGTCFHCGKACSPRELTLDHLVPLARGGRSTPGNMVPSCLTCNQGKKLLTPVEQLFEQLEAEARKKNPPQTADPDPDESD